MPIASINPATGESLKEFAALDSNQIEEKLAKAARAFRSRIAALHSLNARNG